MRALTLWKCLWIAFTLSNLVSLVSAQSNSLARPDYINQLFDPASSTLGLTNLRQAASIATFSGSLGMAGDPNTPGDGHFKLVRAVIGQPIGGLMMATNSVLPGWPLVPMAGILVNGLYNASNSFTLLESNLATVVLESSFQAGTIRYTTNGQQPAGNSTLYTGPFTITSNSTTIRAVAFNQANTASVEANPITLNFIRLYDLSAGSEGGGAVLADPPTGPYASNSIVRLEAVESDGWHFLYWTNDASGADPVLFVQMNRAKAVRAVFGTALAAVPVPEGFGTIQRDPDLPLYAFGSHVRLTAVPAPGAVLSSWGGAAQGADENPLTFDLHDSDLTISAVFGNLPAGQSSLTILVTGGGGTVSKSPSANAYASGTAVNLSAVPDAGYFFGGWRLGGNSLSLATNISVTMNSNVTLTAAFFSSVSPFLGLESPSNGAVFPQNAPVFLRAAASGFPGIGGLPDYVEFRTETALIGRVTNAAPNTNLYEFSWVGAPISTNRIYALGAGGNSPLVTSAPVSISITGLLTAPIFSMAVSSFTVYESNARPAIAIPIEIRKSPGSSDGSVIVQTSDGTALAGDNRDYVAISNLITFSSTNSQTVSITILSNSLSQGDHSFSVFLSNPSNGALINPISTLVIIKDDDLPSATNSVTETPPPIPPNWPAHTGSLQVNLTPASAQWRFVWETAWRNSGSSAQNLPTGDYWVEFSPLVGYVPPASELEIPIVSGQAITTNIMYSQSASSASGGLRVQIFPPGVANNPAQTNRGQWRMRGEEQWHNSGVTNGLPVGTYVIEFKPVIDPDVSWATPLPTYAEVSSNQLNVIPSQSSTYRPGGSIQGTRPSLVSAGSRTSSPYLYCGQVVSGAGYSSGSVVKRRVVLTAAHAVFDSTTMTFMGADWLFQREVGVYEPAPQIARGSIALDGYASRRAIEGDTGESSPQLRHFDVAALYFPERSDDPYLNQPGRGGYGGFVTSDDPVNGWLTSPNLKLVAGYPIEGTAQDGSPITAGKLYQIPPFNDAFQLEPTGLQEDSRVYSSTSFAEFPGNSGAAVCVNYNSKFYPAAVYLGGQSSSMVRSIDSNVVQIINLAEIFGNQGGNNTGGGVIHVNTGRSTSGSVTGYVQVLLGPPSAIAAGAAWRVGSNGDVFLSKYRQFNTNTDPLDLRAVASRGFFTVEYKDIPGFYAPPTQTVSMVVGMNVDVTANYTAWPARLFINPTSLSITGTHGTAYRIEYQNPLNPAGAWSMQHTGVVISNSTTGIVPGTPPTSSGQRFYRALWLDQY